MFSARFQKNVRTTRHAVERMGERHIEESLLLDLIETGTLKWKDEKRFWVFKEYPERNDNLICAAVALDDEFVVKTVMINWQLVE